MRRLQGDPEHPVTRGFLCYRTNQFLSLQYSPHRVTSPLLRRADRWLPIGWDEARTLVMDAYASFSPRLADAAKEFFDGNWIDAPVRPAKRPGAFCAYTVPSHHPYLFLNWTARRRDVSTLDQLTPQELHIAQLLSEGQTTREVAAALFLSPKTIEYHLRSIYRKLGVRSRDALGQALAGGVAE